MNLRLAHPEGRGEPTGDRGGWGATTRRTGAPQAPPAPPRDRPAPWNRIRTRFAYAAGLLAPAESLVADLGLVILPIRRQPFLK